MPNLRKVIMEHRQELPPKSANAAPGTESPLTETGPKLGRKVARQLVAESGLDGTVPPPMSLDPTDRGESDDED